MMNVNVFTVKFVYANVLSANEHAVSFFGKFIKR